MFQVGLPCYLGLNSCRSVSINVDKTRKHFPEKFMARACFPNVRSFPQGKHCFQCQFLFSRCKLCLRYTAENFNENPSMRALARNIFCEHEQASTHLILASNSSKGQILRALSNWMGPLDTPYIYLPGSNLFSSSFLP